MVTLVMSLAFTSQWLCSIVPPPTLQFRFLFDRVDRKFATVLYRIDHTIDRLSSKKSCVAWETFRADGPMCVTTDSIGLWINATDTNIVNLGNDDDNNLWQWRWRCCGFGVGEYRQKNPVGLHLTVWRIPFWSIVTPLTLISGYLLVLKPPKASPKKNLNPPVPSECGS